MIINGRQMTRREIEARVGRIEQIGGIQTFTATGGVQNGVGMIRIQTGAGLDLTVCPGKGMDIGKAQFMGSAISWQSPNGDVHPSYYDSSGTGWLRSASGGLLMTCGLTQAGAANVDEGVSLGLHGRIHHTPASQVSAHGVWVGDDYEMTVSGVLEEVEMFGAKLQLRREYRCKMGENRIRIRDTIENVGFEPSPLMLIYHFNFGFPLMDEQTYIRFPESETRPRIPDFDPDGYRTWGTPELDYPERVYYHTDIQDKGGWAQTQICNPAFPIGFGASPVMVSLRWRTKSLPNLVQWKLLQAGMYVLGLEPSNCWVDGRHAARTDGSLQFIHPGEQVTTELQIEVTLQH